MRVKPSHPVLQRGHPLARGLIGAWPFLERGGHEVADITGLSTPMLVGDNTPASFPSDSWLASEFGSYVKFDLADSDSLFGPTTSRYVGHPVTVSLFARSTSAAGLGWVVARWNSWYLRFDGPTFRINMFDPSERNASFTVTPFRDQWHIYTCVMDIGLLALYLDSELMESNSTPVAYSRSSTNSLRFCEDNWGGSHVDADIADVRIWDRILPASEIAQQAIDLWALYRPRRTVVGFVAAVAITQIINETVQIAESTISARSMVRLIDETTQISETTVFSRALVRLVSETVQIAETSPTTRAIVRLISEVVQIPETTLRPRVVVRLIAEILQVAETTVSARAMVRVFDEVEELVEDSQFTRGLFRVIDEVEEIVEDVQFAKGFVQVVDEVEEIAENVQFVRALVRVVDEVEEIEEGVVRLLVPDMVVTVCTSGIWSTEVSFDVCDSYRIELDGPGADNVRVSATLEFEEDE